MSTIRVSMWYFFEGQEKWGYGQKATANRTSSKQAWCIFSENITENQIAGNHKPRSWCHFRNAQVLWLFRADRYQYLQGCIHLKRDVILFFLIKKWSACLFSEWGFQYLSWVTASEFWKSLQPGQNVLWAHHQYLHWICKVLQAHWHWLYHALLYTWKQCIKPLQSRPAGRWY